MAEDVPIAEAKRRRREREAAARPAQQLNGSHKVVRKVAVVGLNDLGLPDRQDNLVGGILGEAQFGVVYGESGSGKSFLAFDMVMHFAMVQEWMGHKVKGGAVLYIAAEGRGGWANRVEAFCQHHQLDEERRAMLPVGFILESINLGRTANGDIAAVIAAAAEFTDKVGLPISIIVVDTMARATPGSNENDAGDMGAFVANMDAIRRATGSTVLIVHHSGKNAALGARGHSSLRAACDFELEVERSDAGRVLRVRKSRDGADEAEQAFTLQVIEIGRDADDQPVTSCVVVSTAMTETAKRKKAKDKAQWQQGVDQLSNTLVDAPVLHGLGAAFPQGVPVTTVEKFRAALERASIIDGESRNTRNQQWKRIKDRLLAKGLLRIEGEFCWRPDFDER